MVAGSCGKSMFNFLRSCQTVFQSAVPFCILTVMNVRSCCSTPLSALGTVSASNFGHSSKCVLVSHFCFNLHFPEKTDVECLFICLFSICMSSLVSFLLMFLAHCLIRLFVFLLFNLKSFFVYLG